MASPRTQDSGSATASCQPGPAEDNKMAGPELSNQVGDDTTIENGVPQILPKGIVANTSEIYAEVASYKIVPLERLREYWRAQFMMEQQGIPEREQERPQTSETGQDKRRAESPGQDKPDTATSESISKPSKQAETAETAEKSVKQQEIGNTKTRHGEKDDVVQPKKISSSSTRPPPSQSILKKPRPSLAGPRPTPRFALPSGEPADDKPKEGAATGDNAVEGNNVLKAGASAAVGSTSSEQSTPKPKEQSSVITPSSKSGTAKQDGRKAKPKHAKKKFVAGMASSKRKAVVAKRSNSHSSTGSAATEARELVSSRQSEQTAVEEEGVGEMDEMDEIGEIEGIVSSSLGLSDRGADVSPRAHASASNLERQAARPKGTETAGKQPTQPPPLPPVRPQLYTSSPTLMSPTASVGSVTGLATAAAARGPQPVVVHQGPGLSAASGQAATSASLESTGGSGILEISMASRNRRPVSQVLGGPGGTPSRQYTMPEVSSQRKRLATGQGFGVTGAPAPISPGAIPPRLSRSLSQDSYARHHVGDGAQRPALPHGIGSAAIAAPSMVAASGVLIETEGPDPFELYAQTGLDDDEEAERPLVESSSYNEHSPVQRQLFTPTRPSQTPRIPFARTRSQLNIILDREKERLGQGNFASWQESRHRDHEGDDQRSGR
ncbi:hypothetical protein CMQ_4923 [Grosmannia clavigera kw1407]|uniref:Uncharacterized protein n=1 Tax=Grosmannia clavigera (strain kw1407 / UAMH 11150) TaxID=655863 RepID=F0XK45_GROCL|nr:uncharacterized protein CMQ_4923 [Grosmannia clavigera kw1407]EFX01852.1 hypothetical protein CMQ_4923 [Grosmannia clavigera kw1407]